MLYQLLSICSNVTQVQLSNVGAPDNTHMALSTLSYISRLQGIHTILLKACPFISVQPSGLEGSIPVSCSPEQFCHGQRRQNTFSPDHDSATICKTEFYVSPQLLYDYKFNTSCTDAPDLLCWGCLKHYLGLSLGLLFVLPLNTPGGRR